MSIKREQKKPIDKITFLDCFFLLLSFNLVGDRVVIRRRCVYANANESKDACMHEQVSRSIQREFCEICDTDG